MFGYTLLINLKYSHNSIILSLGILWAFSIIADIVNYLSVSILKIIKLYSLHQPKWYLYILDYVMQFILC